MFTTLLMEEDRTRARRNAGVVGIIAAVATGAVLASLLRIPGLSSVSAGSPDWRTCSVSRLRSSFSRCLR